MNFIAGLCFLGAFGLVGWGDISLGLQAYSLRHDDYYHLLFWFWLFINLMIVGALCAAAGEEE
jgi:hypothetical protein